MHVAGHSVRDCVDYVRESACHHVTRVQSCRLTGPTAHTRTVSALRVAHRERAARGSPQHQARQQIRYTVLY